MVLRVERLRCVACRVVVYRLQLPGEIILMG